MGELRISVLGPFQASLGDRPHHQARQLSQRYKAAITCDSFILLTTTKFRRRSDPDDVWLPLRFLLLNIPGRACATFPLGGVVIDDPGQVRLSDKLAMEDRLANIRPAEVSPAQFLFITFSLINSNFIGHFLFPFDLST
jgi:hypothetical protein